MDRHGEKTEAYHRDADQTWHGYLTSMSSTATTTTPMPRRSRASGLSGSERLSVFPRAFRTARRAAHVRDGSTFRSQGLAVPIGGKSVHVQSAPLSDRPLRVVWTRAVVLGPLVRIVTRNELHALGTHRDRNTRHAIFDVGPQSQLGTQPA
jgi:hypothetical protein